MGKVRQHFNDPRGGVKLRIGEEMDKKRDQGREGLGEGGYRATKGNKYFKSLSENAMGCVCFKMREEN